MPTQLKTKTPPTMATTIHTVLLPLLRVGLLPSDMGCSF
jgi:hypothetical protein